jgi:pimeloyl-ACP methyl ester carboxylesterase
MVMKKSVKILLIMLILIGLASCASLQVASPPPTWPIPEGIKTVDVNGYHMAYQETGSGTPVVLIPGSLSDYRTWDTQVPDFSKGYRTFALSLRHYYPEKWNGIGDDFSVAQHAADVAAMIKKLNLGKVHLLGHSRGGSIAVTVASRYPEVIRTLILEEANLEPLMPETPEKQKRVAEGKVRGEAVRANLATGDREKAAREWLVSYGGAWEKVPERVQKILIENIGTATESGERGKFTCADIQKFNFPILLLNGGRGQKLYSDMNAAMRQCKPDIPAPVIVPNAGHSIHRENAPSFNKTVLDFANKH